MFCNTVRVFSDLLFISLGKGLACERDVGRTSDHVQDKFIFNNDYKIN